MLPFMAEMLFSCLSENSGELLKKLVKGTTLNTKQDLNFSLNWQVFIMVLPLADRGEILMVAELNTAGIYSGIKGARLIGFLSSEL